MKNLFILFATLFIGLSANAQQHAGHGGNNTGEVDHAKMEKAKELMKINLGMKVDTNLFKAITTNTYMSEAPTALVMAIVIPSTYEEQKKKMNIEKSESFKVTSKGEKMMNGVKVLYMMGTSAAKGMTIENTIYCVKRDNETSVMFVGMSELNIEKKYKDAISEAASSVIKKY